MHPSNKLLGVYSIRNTIDGKMYIGSSKRLLDRYTDHKRELRKETHHARHLQHAVDKHGIENFEYMILELLDSTADLLLHEDYWIRKNDTTNPDKGYNYIYYGRKYQLESPTKRRFVDRKKYLVVSPHGEKFEVENLPDFCRSRELCESTMRKVASGKFRHTKMWRCWEWECQPDTIPHLHDFVNHYSKIRNDINRENIKDRNASQHRWIYHFTKTDGSETVISKSVKEFCRQFSISSKQMFEVVNGKRTEWRGWLCHRVSLA